MKSTKFKDHLLSVARQKYGIIESDIPHSYLARAIACKLDPEAFVSYLKKLLHLQTGDKLLDTCNDLLNPWQIVDDQGVVYTGSEACMSEAFEGMTVSFHELSRRYPDREKSELKAQIERWKKPWLGTLKLIEVHDTFS